MEYMLKQFVVWLERPWVQRGLLGLWIASFIGLVFMAFDPEPWARMGYWGAFVFNLFGPGTLLIPLMAPFMNIWVLAVVSALGMTINDSWSYLAGKAGAGVVEKNARVKRIEGWLNHANWFVLFGLAIVPLPYDLIGVVAGYMGIDMRRFLSASFLGKFVRFVLLGWGTVVGLSVFG